MKSKRFAVAFVAALVLCLTIALVAQAQGQRRPFAQGVRAQAMGQVDHLARLKNALQAAGATALTSDQESTINSAITSFRSSHTPPTPNPAVQSARTALDSAILKGTYDSNSASVIVQAMASNETTRLQELGNFAISVVKVLGGDQVSALVTKFGTDRVVRLLESLVVGPGPGRGGAGMGMGMGMGIGPVVR